MTDVPTEALEAATRAVHNVDCPEGELCMETMTSWGRYGRYASAALAAAAPHLIAEGRRQAAEAIRAEAQREIETQGSWFWFVHGESRLEGGGDWAARIAEGEDHA